MSHTINQATIDMLDTVVDASVRPLLEDPVWIWIFGAGGDLEQRLRPWLGVWLDGMIKLGDVWCVGDAVGYAILLPPDDGVDLYQIETQAWPVFREMAKYPDRYLQFWDWAIDAAPSSGYRLLGLAVDPAHRGTGVGSALMQHCLDIAHRDDELISLIAPSQTAADYFSRFGLRVVVNGEPPGGGPTAWIMSI